MSSHGNNLTSRFENRDDIKEDVGFSPHSQELISQLYHSFDESQSYRDDLLTVLHSVIDDMHKYKTDSERLEQAHKNEKEKNEEIMTNMIEEAERQLVISNERIKDNITNEYEKVIQKLNEQHDTEIASLQEAINRSQLLEKKLRESKKKKRVLDFPSLKSR